jgi:putative iron-dependent peroxidase
MSDIPEFASHAGNVQAIVGSAFPTLRKCHYLLLRITDHSLATGWIRQVINSGLIRTVADLVPNNPNAGPHRTDMMMLAFTYAGLRALRVRESADYPFPTAFKVGMASEVRGQLLRDGDHRDWKWGDVDLAHATSTEVHILAAYYSDNLHGNASFIQADSLAAAGLQTVESIATCPSYLQQVDRQNIGYEPFGFRDGIAQPVIRGLRVSESDQRDEDSAGALYADRVVAPGEFVLGLPNEYGETANCPDAEGWPAWAADPQTRFGLDGSYLVVRKIYQEVEEFRQFEQAHSKPLPGANAPTAAEKMFGRKKDGTPLVTCPVAPPEIDAFRYRVADQSGFQCPRGAHIRRANPRDSQGQDVESGIKSSKLHRLMRRGRVYAGAPSTCEGGGQECGADNNRKSCGQGLFFIALNADLERQFEFIQQRWIGDTQFGDLSNEDDPILGTTPPQAFSIPAVPVGTRLENFAQFTKVLGGGYFFLPSLKALEFIAK